MRPSLDRFLEVAAAHLMLKTAPALATAYEQSSAMLLGVMLTAVREEHERAASRRAEENATLRALFADALEAVEEPALRARLEAASQGADASLLVSDLEQANVELRSLLIELHAHVEERPGEAARRVEAAIWRELVASTERRRLSLGTF